MTLGIVRGGDVKVRLGDKLDCYLRISCMECLDWTLTEVTLTADAFGRRFVMLKRWQDLVDKRASQSQPRHDRMWKRRSQRV